MRLAVLALLLFAPAARGQDPLPAAPAVKLPNELKVKQGTLGELKAETTGKAVKWLVLTPGLDVRTCDTGRTLLFTGPDGVYLVCAYTAAGDVPSDAAKCLVTIGTPAPPGPGPGPTPGPPPPAPSPVPVDGLKAKLRDAIAASAGTADQKREWTRDLAALYRAAAKIVPDPTLTTAGQLREKLRGASAALIGADALKEVRAAVAVELAGVLPTADGDLTDGQRVAAAALFARLAALLEELSQ